MSSYEKIVKENEKRNAKFISEFEKMLKRQKLSEKTIRKHLQNVDLFLNDYLNYYYNIKMEDGTIDVDIFLSDWYIEKCLFASKTSLQEEAASLKKFYKYMSELGYVKKDDYEFLAKLIKDNMDYYLEKLEEFDNYDEDDEYYDIW